ncbi:MurR/RpiR family transcriptional regulator [Lacticaseibacillus daqingensis]|uniref:MurR/RpiR family transcriptional regulator n=1 Tax=Lacticaseibacillus daqingensis TaxID=2486014 RepID=UPI000F7690C5|nr:MurR/RpiR family transcriptional regulator [Lacticaseibacillus daqingensis]
MFNQRVAKHIQKLSPSEEKILAYITEHYNQIPSKRIGTIANDLYMSPNALVRFAKKLQYSGFSELKFDISADLSEHPNKMTPTAAIGPDGYYDIGENIIGNLRQTLDINREAYFVEAADLVATYNKIAFVALGLSNSSLSSFTRRLEVLNKVCLVSKDRDNALTLSRSLDDTFLVFIVSLSGETDVLSECLTSFKEQHCKIITITGLNNNPLHHHSDLSFYVPYERQSIHGIDMSSRICITFFLDIMVQYIYQNLSIR